MESQDSLQYKQSTKGIGWIPYAEFQIAQKYIKTATKLIPALYL